VETVQLIVAGKVLFEQAVPSGKGQGRWIELERVIELSHSSWIAARAFGQAPSGAPDAESHTNPVYVDLNGRAPYDRDLSIAWSRGSISRLPCIGSAILPKRHGCLMTFKSRETSCWRSVH
jgi:hypothetical protein